MSMYAYVQMLWHIYITLIVSCTNVCVRACGHVFMLCLCHTLLLAICIISSLDMEVCSLANNFSVYFLCEGSRVCLHDRKYMGKTLNCHVLQVQCLL